MICFRTLVKNHTRLKDERIILLLPRPDRHVITWFGRVLKYGIVDFIDIVLLSFLLSDGVKSTLRVIDEDANPFIRV